MLLQEAMVEKLRHSVEAQAETGANPNPHPHPNPYPSPSPSPDPTPTPAPNPNPNQVSQFCRGASREVSLVLLGLLPAAVLQGPAAGGGDEEGGGEGGGEVLCLLMEAALQAHLTHAGLEAAESSAGPPLELVSAPLAVLGAALASRPALTVQGVGVGVGWR